MKLKKLLILIMFFLLVLPFKEIQAIENLEIYSPTVILIDSNSGKILYERNINEKMYPASVTKIMTAIIAIENCSLEEMAIVKTNAVMTVPAGHSIANLQIGEEFTIKDLLYATLLKSGNDAANVLAEHVSDSIEDFAVLMNEKAIELGCTNTNFVNPSGIHNNNHYTTAYDLSLIAKYCMQNEVFREIVSTTTYTLPATSKYPENDRVMSTTNDMLRFNTSAKKDNYYYPYCIGIKTGYTSQAKNTLVSAATRDGLEFIVVILGAEQTPEALSHRYLDSIALFDYAFEHYMIRKIIDENNLVSQVYIDKNSLDLYSSQSITVVVKNENYRVDFEPEISLNESLSAPIKKGDIVGTATYDIEGIKYTFDLIAGNNINKTSILSIVVRCIVILVIFYIVILVLNKKSKRNKKYKYSKFTTYNRYQ